MIKNGTWNQLTAQENKILTLQSVIITLTTTDNGHKPKSQKGSGKSTTQGTVKNPRTPKPKWLAEHINPKERIHES